MYVYQAIKRPKNGPQRTYYYDVCQMRHGGQKRFARQKGIDLQPYVTTVTIVTNA